MRAVIQKPSRSLFKVNSNLQETNLPTDGFPSVLILECPTDTPFSQIHWSWTYKRTYKAQNHVTKKPIMLHNWSIINTLDLSGKRKQYDSVNSCSVRPSCFISLRFSMNCHTKGAGSKLDTAVWTSQTLTYMTALVNKTFVALVECVT